MQIRDIKEINSCFDGLFVKDILFSNTISKDFLEYLSRYGKFEYQYNFPKPLYKLKIDDKFIIKGMEGKKYARLVLSGNNLSEAIEYLNKILSNYLDNNNRVEINLNQPGYKL